MSNVKAFTIKLDNLSVEAIAKIQNEIENRIPITQLVTKATKRKRGGIYVESATKRRKNLDEQKVKLQFVEYT